MKPNLYEAFQKASELVKNRKQIAEESASRFKDNLAGRAYQAREEFQLAAKQFKTYLQSSEFENQINAFAADASIDLDELASDQERIELKSEKRNIRIRMKIILIFKNCSKEIVAAAATGAMIGKKLGPKGASFGAKSAGFGVVLYYAAIALGVALQKDGNTISIDPVIKNI